MITTVVINTKILYLYSELNSVPSKIHVHLEPQNVPLFGNKIFADDSLFRFVNLLVWLTELRKAGHLPLPVYYKGYISGTVQWKRHRA